LLQYRIFLLNKNDYRIKDTWDATGLRGTGSNDVEVSDAFVAEPMTVAVNDLGGGRSRESASIRMRSTRCRCSRCFPMCCPASRLEMRRPVSTTMSISHGIV